MGDVTNSSVTSPPPGLMTSLSANVSADVTTTALMSLANVTQCVFNEVLNETACMEVVTTDAAGNQTAILPPHGLWMTIFLGVLAGGVSIVTVLGNLTVLLAFGLERSIRQPTNYFIASLAVSDLLIGMFSMPLFTQYLLLNYWHRFLGPWLCDLWLSMDFTVCLTSQYTVFFITLDRFLSVKIPAKYRNWRTERKVLIMVAGTWIFPAAVFFTTIIGWQYFVEVGRTVGELECYVQFMNNPLFTFCLTIGYYWITLIVMCILYAGIYKVALDLQRKSDAKQRKLESTMELAADHSKNTGSNSTDSDRGRGPAAYFRKRKNKKSLRSNEADGSEVPSADQNNVQQKGHGQGQTNTTSFTGKNKLKAKRHRKRQDSLGGGSVATDAGDNKEEDRSSSPAFASDDEGSSSGHTPNSKSPKGFGSGSGGSKTNNNRRSTKCSLNPKAGIAGIVNTAMLTTPDTFRASLDIGRPPQLLAITAPPTPPAIAAPSSDAATSSPSPPQHGTRRSPSPSRTEKGRGSGSTNGDSTGTPMPPSGQQCLRMGGPSYSRLQSLADENGGVYTDEKPQADNSYGGVYTGDDAFGGVYTGESSHSTVVSGAKNRGGGRKTEPVASGGNKNDNFGGVYTGESTNSKNDDSFGGVYTGENSYGGVYTGGNSNSNAAPNEPLLNNDSLIQGCPYIDEKSFMQLTGGSPMAGLRVPAKNGAKGENEMGGNERESPLWKRRNSLPLPPLAGDIFDIVIDDDFPSYGVTEVSTLPATSKLNGGKDVCHDDDDGEGDNSEGCEGDGSGVPCLARPDEAGETDSQRLEPGRRGGARNKGGDRLHSFVKSVRSRNSRRRNRRERKSKSENRARKALRTITIILGAFLVCWTPYHIMICIIAICGGIEGCVNLGFYNFTYWLCYLNSPINPFCYAFANAQFKRTFLRILRFDWHRT